MYRFLFIFINLIITIYQNLQLASNKINMSSITAKKMKEVIKRLYGSSDIFSSDTISRMAGDVAEYVFDKIISDCGINKEQIKVSRELVRFIFWNNVLVPLNVSGADIDETVSYQLVDGGGLENEFEQFFSAFLADFYKNTGVTLRPIYDLPSERDGVKIL